MKCRDGFSGEQEIRIPDFMLNRAVCKKDILQSLFITHIGSFLKAKYHYREEKRGCKDFILLYCQYGKGSIENRYGKKELVPNQFMIIPPNEFYRLQADLDDPWSIYWVHFNTNRSEELSQEFNLEQFFNPTNIFYKEQILEEWHQIYECLACGYSTLSILNANLHMYCFLCLFLFKSESLAEAKEDPLEKSIQYMKANIRKRLKVDEIASYVQFSTSHFTALFKKKTGMAPLDYFIKLKIRHACHLLVHNKLKVKDIANMVGYDDPYFFSKLFKQVTGKSPKDYKQIPYSGLHQSNMFQYVELQEPFTGYYKHVLLS